MAAFVSLGGRPRSWARRVATPILLGIGLSTACATAPPGPITFGSPESPETRFPLDEDTGIPWIAVLSEPVEDASVNLVISPQGGDRELFGYRQFITDPGAITLVNEMPIGRFIRQPGVYVMRYLSVEGDVLAEGEFELVADSD